MSDEQILFFDEKRIKASLLIRHLINEYKEFKEWKAAREKHG